MRRIFSVPVFLLLVAAFREPAVAASDPPRVSRSMLVASEKSLDTRFQALWDDPFLLLGPTRGIYLEGYGAVLTAEINLVVGPPVLLVRVEPNKEEIAKHRKKKLERMPELMRAARQALMDTAASLDTLPAQEQVVIVMFLSRYQWEDTHGIPVQIKLQAPKAKLLDIQKAPGAARDAALEAAIQIEQF
jgi:hypothetical protein